MNKTISYEIEMTETLYYRMFVAAENEGIMLQTFIEQALREAITDSEKNVASNAPRDSKAYPHECHCGERFKLAMHLANHQRARHPEPFVEPEPEWIAREEPKPILDDVGLPYTATVVESPFKLGVDPKYIEMDPEPEVDPKDFSDEYSFLEPKNDFSSDVPDFG